MNGYQKNKKSTATTVRIKNEALEFYVKQRGLMRWVLEQYYDAHKDDDAQFEYKNNKITKIKRNKK